MFVQELASGVAALELAVAIVWAETTATTTIINKSSTKYRNSGTKTNKSQCCIWRALGVVAEGEVDQGLVVDLRQVRAQVLRYRRSTVRNWKPNQKSRTRRVKALKRRQNRNRKRRRLIAVMFHRPVRHRSAKLTQLTQQSLSPLCDVLASGITYLHKCVYRIPKIRSFCATTSANFEHINANLHQHCISVPRYFIYQMQIDFVTHFYQGVVSCAATLLN